MTVIPLVFIFIVLNLKFQFSKNKHTIQTDSFTDSKSVTSYYKYQISHICYPICILNQTSQMSQLCCHQI